MCGSASGAQSTLAGQSGAFYNELSSAYNETFGETSSILKEMHNGWSPIFEAGVGQQGWTPAEAAAINTNTINTVGENYKHAANATAEVLAARGGGNEVLPSGVDAAIQAGVSEKAAGQLSAEQNANTIENYRQGRENFFRASGALSDVAKLENPLGYAGEARATNDQAFKQQTQINMENNSWKNDLIGSLTSIAGDVIGAGMFTGGGKKGGSSGGSD